MKILSTLVTLLIALSLTACNSTAKSPKYEATSVTEPELAKLSQATFASGCFWCVEAVFESVKGVKEAVSGYAGGTEANPTYEQVGSGATGHAEAVTVYYDPTLVSYETLLKVYFASEDPTQVNGQGPDHGRQYRSIIFYKNDSEKKLAEDYIAQLNSSGKYNEPIAAEVVPFTKFWKAEDYHKIMWRITQAWGMLGWSQFRG